MIQAYHDHADHRDQFELIAIHDSTVKSFDELDRKIQSVKAEYWKGQDLPFTVLIDKERKTEEVFGVSAHPTQVLIDPDGNVVGESSLMELEKKLPPLPAATRWARHRDLQKNVHWTWDEKTKLSQILKSMGMFTQLECKIDPEFAKAAGLDLDAELKFYVDGYGITLRSLEQMMFESYGGQFEPAREGNRLVLKKRSSESDEPLSHFQKLHNQQLVKRIDPKAAKNGGSRRQENESGKSSSLTKLVESLASSVTQLEKKQPLELEEVRLRDAVTRTAQHFSLPMGISHAAYEMADVKVTGRIEDDRLKATLNQMLDPIGLEVIVKYEMILVVPVDQ